MVHDFDNLQKDAGVGPAPATGASQVPIWQTMAFVFLDVKHDATFFNLREAG